MSEIEYIRVVHKVLEQGIETPNRTGVSSKKINNVNLTYDLSEGFPLFTHRKNFFNVMAVELEGFIKGITSKQWYKDRGCNIWNQWANPEKVPYYNDPKIIKLLQEEDDLGHIYGAEWRNYNKQGIDQLQSIIDTLKTNPFDRRMIVSAWNPSMDHCKALPACHMIWGLNVINDTLHLNWTQRSCDLLLGHATTTYALLLHLLAKESGLKAGTINATYWDCHIYMNQIEAAEEIVRRGYNQLYKLPDIKTENFTSLMNWKHSDTIIENYKYHDKINIPIAI